MLVYRVTKEAYALDLSGMGASLDGGRWNSAGNPMVYTSESRSLAVLEILAHATILPLGLVTVTIELPPHLRLLTMHWEDLPSGWDTLPATSKSQNIGNDFLRGAKLLALRVPSVIVSEESNILINPLHSLARKIKIIEVEPLRLDSRLK